MRSISAQAPRTSDLRVGMDEVTDIDGSPIGFLAALRTSPCLLRHHRDLDPPCSGSDPRWAGSHRIATVTMLLHILTDPWSEQPARKLTWIEPLSSLIRGPQRAQGRIESKIGPETRVTALQTLVIGTGYFWRIQVPEEMLASLCAAGVEARIAKISDAVDDFNCLQGECERFAVAALHHTC